jgi:hypothetical protein
MNTHRGAGRPINNIALVPASLLPLREQWQALANTLPAGGILICLPTRNELLAGSWEEIVRSARAMGRWVLVIPVEHFLDNQQVSAPSSQPL